MPENLRETLVSCIRKYYFYVWFISWCAAGWFYSVSNVTYQNILCSWTEVFLAIMYGKLFIALILLYGQIKKWSDDVCHKELSINNRNNI